MARMVLQNAVYHQLFGDGSDEEHEQAPSRKRTRCWLKTHFATLSEEQFESHLRMSRACFSWIHEIIKPMILHLRCMNSQTTSRLDELRAFALSAYEIGVYQAPKQGGRPWSFTTEEELAITMIFLSTGNSEGVVERQCGAAPASLWRIVRRVCMALDVVGRPRFVHWPTSARQWKELADGFFAASRGRMYGAVGAIDNTHISVKLPRNARDGAIDRTASWSIHIQAVCSADWRILSWRVGDMGSRQDSGVLQASALWRAQEGGGAIIPKGHFLIGDAGFPCRPWLMVPWSRRNNGQLTPRKLHFNKIFCGQRVVVEQLFGILKSKWQVLCSVRQFANFHTPKAMMLYSTAVAVIHNAMLQFGDITPNALFRKANELQGGGWYSHRDRLLHKTTTFQDIASTELHGKQSHHRDHTRKGFEILGKLMDAVVPPGPGEAPEKNPAETTTNTRGSEGQSGGRDVLTDEDESN